jgi:uncharacterized protein (TIGR04255 family)
MRLMPFPPSPRVIFEVNPLAEVVCELRFPPSLRIAAQPPADFQERIRASYPILQPQPTRLIDQIGGFGPGAAGLQITEEGGAVTIGQGFNLGMGGQPTYVFTNEAGTRTVTLSQGSLAVAERQYERWEVFRAEIETLMGYLNELYHPGFFTRVGLRYQDLLDRTKLGLSEVPWPDLLHPEFAGLFGAGSPVSNDVVRIGSVAVLALPDPEGARVRLQHGSVDDQEDAHNQYAIDSDFFLVERSDSVRVLSCLDEFHVHAGNLFRWAISGRLHQALRPQPLPARNAA